jgi:hypothetical protein
VHQKDVNVAVRATVAAGRGPEGTRVDGSWFPAGDFFAQSLPELEAQAREHVRYWRSYVFSIQLVDPTPAYLGRANDPLLD